MAMTAEGPPAEGPPPEGPLAKYRALVAAGKLRGDPIQELAAQKLNSLHLSLIGYSAAARNGKKGWMRRFSLKPHEDAPALHGLYLYGGVGRGKSMLMDMFYEGAPTPLKQRVHFHAFLRDIHAEIHRLRQMPIPQEGDPIPGMADGIADHATLLCIDELEVRDIADAMIVGRLFQKLFDRHVVVVATSNRYPDDLYKDGLQRERFVPFINLIKERLDILQLEGTLDYRLGRIVGSPVYHSPLGPAADAALDQAWARLTDESPLKPDHLLVQGRRIEVPAAAHRVARFTFAELCERPLGPIDYLALGVHFAALIVKDIPRMSEDNKDAARRFVTLIDALYEHRCMLVCSAAAPPQELYSGASGGFEFQRTVLRLIEMQAADYLRQRHLA
ncbi:MAG: cell division protein ZapE [Rhodospirillaceae bacterium]|nr:cell division protein ZapE [Rhodospirillaceae bacterium]